MVFWGGAGEVTKMVVCKLRGCFFAKKNGVFSRTWGVGIGLKSLFGMFPYSRLQGSPCLKMASSLLPKPPDFVKDHNTHQVQ